MHLPQLLVSATLAALATVLATDSSENCHDSQIAILDRDNPVVGDKCSRNQECAANFELYCSPKKGTCQERSGPSAACENDDACFQGKCRAGVCGGLPENSPCQFYADCDDPLVCRPQLVRGRGYELQCLHPARHRDFGSRCRDDGDCGFPYYCVIPDLDHFCGVNPNCVERGSRCSTDKDCCPSNKCVWEARSSYGYYACSYAG